MPLRVSIIRRIIKLVTASALGNVKALGGGDLLVGKTRFSRCLVGLRKCAGGLTFAPSVRRFAARESGDCGNDSHGDEQAHQKPTPTIRRMFTRSWPSSSRW